MTHNLADIFPVLDIQSGKMVNDDHVITVGFSIAYEEVFLRDKNSYNALQENQRMFIRQLPDYAIMQTLSFFDEETHIPEFHTIDNYMKRYNALYYLGRSIPVQKEYIFISFGKRVLPKTAQRNTIVKGLSAITKNPYGASLEYAEQITLQIDNVSTAMEALYKDCNIKRLTDKEIAQALYEYASFEYNAAKRDDFTLPGVNFKDNIIGEYKFAVFSLYEGNRSRSFAPMRMTNPDFVKSNIKQIDQPGTINQSQIFPVTIGLPFKHAYSCVIQKIPKSEVMMQFEIQERALQLPAQFNLSAAANKLEDIKLYRSLLNDEDYAPIRLSMAVVIPEKNKDILNMKKEALKTAVGGIFEMKGVDENEEAGLVLFSHLPGNTSINYKHALSTAFHAVSYLPKESHYKSDNIGSPFTDRFGRQVLINIINNPHMTNRNGVVIGPSGRGKSFALNYLVKLLYNDSHIIIIDKGGSYKNLVSLLGGKYLDSAQEDLFQFNVFITEKDKNGKFLVDSIQINFILSVLLFIWKEGEKAKNEEKEILKEFIAQYYDAINKTKTYPSFTGFIDFIKENRAKFDKTFERFFDYESFFLMTKQYASGTEKKLLNAQDNIDLTYEKLTVFEMEAIEKSNPTKFNLLCIIITFLNIKKIQRLPKHTQKSFIVDEALSFLKGDIGDFIGNLYAEFRKKNGQVLVVAQGIKFLLEASSEVQEKIFSNRDFIAMTNHEGYENAFDTYQQLLGFTEKDIELLAATKKQEEMFFRFGSKPMILRIEASEEEYGVFTTKPSDMKKIAELEKQYQSIQTAIEVFAAQKRSLIKN